MQHLIPNSRVIVTGASSGIGREVALELARQGAKLVVVARREDRLRQLADQIAALGQTAIPVVGDVTDPAIRQQAIDAAQQKLGGLDFLINNAGVGALGPFQDASVSRVRRVMELNYFALVEMTRLAVPLLKQSVNAMVVNISSIVGLRGVPNRSEYSASKFAVQGFSEAIRAEFFQHGIDVLVVSPGPTETEFFDKELEKTMDANWPKHKPANTAKVARQIVHAIRKGRHAIIPYSWGRVLDWLNRLSPRLVDSIMTRYV